MTDFLLQIDTTFNSSIAENARVIENGDYRSESS